MGNLAKIQTSQWKHYTKCQIIDAIAFWKEYDRQLWLFQDQLKIQYENALKERVKIIDNFDQYKKKWQKQNSQQSQQTKQKQQTKFKQWIKHNRDKIDHEFFRRVSSLFFDQYDLKIMNKKIQKVISKFQMGKKALIHKQQICHWLQIQLVKFNEQIILHRVKIKQLLNDQFANQLHKFKQYVDKQIKDLLKKMQILENVLNNKDAMTLDQLEHLSLDNFSKTKTVTNSTQ